MVMLVLASIWCWAIIFEKLLTVRRLNKRSDEFEQAFWSGKSLDDLFDKVSSNPREPDVSCICCCDARMAARVWEYPLKTLRWALLTVSNGLCKLQ